MQSRPFERRGVRPRAEQQFHGVEPADPGRNAERRFAVITHGIEVCAAINQQPENRQEVGVFEYRAAVHHVDHHGVAVRAHVPDVGTVVQQPPDGFQIALTHGLGQFRFRHAVTSDRALFCKDSSRRVKVQLGIPARSVNSESSPSADVPRFVPPASRIHPGQSQSPPERLPAYCLVRHEADGFYTLTERTPTNSNSNCVDGTADTQRWCVVTYNCMEQAGSDPVICIANTDSLAGITQQVQKVKVACGS